MAHIAATYEINPAFERIAGAASMLPNQLSVAVMLPNQLSVAVMLPNRHSVAVFLPNRRSVAVFLPNRHSVAVFLPNRRSAAVMPVDQRSVAVMFAVVFVSMFNFFVFSHLASFPPLRTRSQAPSSVFQSCL